MSATQPNTESPETQDSDETVDNEIAAEAEEATPEVDAVQAAVKEAAAEAAEAMAAEVSEAADDASEARIAELEAALAEQKEQWVRTVAELDNFRKRAAREREDAGKYAISNFAGDMIAVLENLIRATQSIGEEQKAQNQDVANLATGVEMTLNELLSAFERHGIQRIDPMGDKFDHNLHQAIAQIESPDHEPGTVVQVIQAGYKIADRLLRPAMVGVAKAPASEAPAQVDTEA